MTHTTIAQLTADSRQCAKDNDLRFRLRKVKELYDAAPSGSDEKKRLGVIGRKLYAELFGGK